MDKDRIVEAAKEIKGSVKETIGKAVGDAKLEFRTARPTRLRARSRMLSAVSGTR